MWDYLSQFPRLTPAHPFIASATHFQERCRINKSSRFENDRKTTAAGAETSDCQSWAGTLGARPHVLSLTSKALLLERWSYNIELMGGQTFVYLIEMNLCVSTLAVADNENTLD